MRLAEGIVSATDDEENDRQNNETGHLNRLAAESVDSSDGGPVAWDSTGADQNQVSDCVAVKGFIDILASSPADRAEDDGVVETKTVESYREGHNFRIIHVKYKQLGLVDDAYQCQGRTTSPQYPREP